MSSKKKITHLIKKALQKTWLALRILKIWWLSDRLLCWLKSLLDEC